MVGFVIVSHSCKLAEGVVDLTKMMAPEAKIAAAGGMEDGGYGTSFDRIAQAIESVYSEDGVIVLMDMGSAVMTTEMVIESMDDKLIKMADCPVTEGAVSGTVYSKLGMDIDEIIEELADVGSQKKL